LCSCGGRSPDARRRSTASNDWAPAFAGELAPAPAAAAYPLRAVRGAPARRRMGGVSAGAARPGQTFAVGAGADGDPGKRTDPSAGAARARAHPCRGPRREGRAVGDGGGVKMRRALGRDRRDLGRPARARFYRDAAACRRFGAVWRGRLFDSARRPRQFERRAHALADRIRPFACQRAGFKGAGHARVGRRIVSCPGNAARTLERRP